MNTTTPAGAQTEAQQEIERNFRFNFTVNALDGASFWLGYSFIAPTIILPLYVKHFTDNPLIFGLLSFINTAGVLLPQLFTANAVERAPQKKIFPVKIGFFTERMPILLLPLSVALLAKDHPGLALLSFLLLFIWFTAGAGVTVVGWQDMVAKIIPYDRRGRFFGITQFAANTSSILGALAVSFVLGNYAFPTGYIISFGTAAFFIFLSWIFISLTREPAVYNPKPVVSQTAYFRSLPQVIRNDRNFRLYLLYSTIFSLGMMAANFVIVYGSQNWNLPDSQASGFIIAMQVGQAAANLFLGFLADRKGHKLALEIGVLASTLSFLLVFIAPAPGWFYPIFFLRGTVQAALMISGVAIVMEFTGPENRPTYIGLANTIPGIAGSIGPLFAGLLASIAGYPVMFAISSLLSAAGFFLLHFMVRDPREKALSGALQEEAAQVQ